MPRKTIDDVRNELRKAQVRNKELNSKLKSARTDTWREAFDIARCVERDYPTDVFAPPGPESSADCYAAAGARIAAQRIQCEIKKEIERK